ncbi:MAG TPA: protein kinase [Pyrinomonadaceae bacterium]
MICSTCKASNVEAARLCANCGAALRLEGDTPQQSGRTGALVDREGDPLLGSTIVGKYRIDAKVGAGGMGAVFRATRLLIGDEVAVKILHSEQNDPRAADRFRREAQAAARLKHPNAVTILDFGTSEEGLQYLVMDLVEGESLRQILKQQGPLTPSASAEIIKQVCAALDEAHRLNIIHRDIKPDNIIVNAAANSLRVKVLDFGIAKLRDDTAANLTQTGSILGTPHYMSPEQCLGEELDHRSDIYSLGVVAYEMLTGLVPFNSPTSSAVIVQQVTQAPVPLRALNASITDATERAVLHALEKQRQARPQTSGEFAHEFSMSADTTVRPDNQIHGLKFSLAPQSAASTAVLPRATASTGENAKTHKYPNLWAYVAAGLGIVVLLGIGFLLVRPWRDEASSPHPAKSGSLKVTASASSARSPSRGVTYDPANIVDGNLATAWDEGVSGPGIGEWIRFDFDRQVTLLGVRISPGYFKTAKLWGENNRLAAATLEFSDGSSRDFHFADRMEEQSFDIGGVQTQWIRMTIDRIYSGSTDAEDTPISEIVFNWQERSQQVQSSPANNNSLVTVSQPSPTVNVQSTEQNGTWFVFLGAFPKTDYEKANERLHLVQRSGYSASIIDTDNYPALRGGLWAVVMGPYSKPYAKTVANQVRAARPDVYIKSGW